MPTMDLDTKQIAVVKEHVTDAGAEAFRRIEAILDGSSPINTQQPFTGAVTRTQRDKNAESVSVKDFGAIGDGTLHTVAEWIPSRYADLAAVQAVYPFVTDAGYSIDLLAFNAVLAAYAANRNNPPRYNARGLGRIIVPKGKYIINGTITVASPLTVVFEGDGAEASSIIYTLDNGNCFNLTTYTYITFRDMSFINDTATAQGSLTSTLFNLNGNGGGRKFYLDSCITYRFNRICNHNNTINEDTNRFHRCTFDSCNTFLYARNSQAVINGSSSCTWYGTINRVFDISGYGFTHIDTSNIVITGTFLYLAPGFDGTASQYLITNAKFEWEPKGEALGTTKIVETEDSQANSVYIKLLNCGISGGSPLPSVQQFDIKCGGIILEVDGGQWAGCNISTKAQTALGNVNSSWIRFKNCASAPNTAITRVSGVSGAAHFPVVFENCKNVANICFKGSGLANNLASSGVGTDRNSNTKNASGYLALGSATQTHAVLTYGQPVLVDKIRVIFSNRAGLVGCTIAAHADEAKTIQIGSTINVPDGSVSTPSFFEIAVPTGTFTSEGVFVTVTNTSAGGGAAGSVFVDTISF